MAEIIRIDKWLWAARFFRTRALAREAIKGGKVHLDGVRVKPGRTLSPGDRLTIRRGDEEYIVNGLLRARPGFPVTPEPHEDRVDRTEGRG